jgi:hypothetical protein
MGGKDARLPTRSPEPRRATGEPDPLNMALRLVGVELDVDLGDDLVLLSLMIRMMSAS